MNSNFMISNFIILFFICLPSLLICGDENRLEGKFDDMIRKLCLEKNFMLERGSSNKVAPGIMRDKIKKFIDKITRGHYWDPVRHIGVSREAKVSEHGQLLGSNTIASQQAVITNMKALIIDQVNNDIKDSQVSQFQLNSRPTISTRENLENRSEASLTQYTDGSACDREVENKIRRALMQSNHFKPEMPYNRRNRKFSDKNDYDPIELSKYREKMFRQGNSDAEKVAAVSIQEKISIGKYGYDVDLDQIATGDSANSLSSSIIDEQSHSNYKSSKISAFRLAASFNTV